MIQARQNLIPDYVQLIIIYPEFSGVLNKIYVKSGEEVVKGQTLAIIGESGSGKSSLIRLIAGIIKPTKGSIHLNDYAFQNVNLNYYRSNVGLSLSEEMPFEGTLRENIIFNNPSIVQAAKNELNHRVGDDFIYKALLGERNPPLDYRVN